MSIDVFIINADDRRERMASSGVVCLSVFPHDISKIDAAGITKLDIKLFHHES